MGAITLVDSLAGILPCPAGQARRNAAPQVPWSLWLGWWELLTQPGMLSGHPHPEPATLSTGLGAGPGWELWSHATLVALQWDRQLQPHGPKGLRGESPVRGEPHLSPAAVQLWQEPAALRRGPGLSLSFNTAGRKQRAKAMSHLGKNHARKKLPRG